MSCRNAKPRRSDRSSPLVLRPKTSMKRSWTPRGINCFRERRLTSAERWVARSKRGESISPDSIWCCGRVRKLSRLGAPATGGLITTRSPRSSSVQSMAARNSVLHRSACRHTDLTVIRADGSKRIGNPCRSFLTRAHSAKRRSQPVRRRGNGSTPEISEPIARTLRRGLRDAGGQYEIEPVACSSDDAIWRCCAGPTLPDLRERRGTRAGHGTAGGHRRQGRWRLLRLWRIPHRQIHSARPRSARGPILALQTFQGHGRRRDLVHCIQKKRV